MWRNAVIAPRSSFQHSASIAAVLRVSTLASLVVLLGAAASALAQYEDDAIIQVSPPALSAGGQPSGGLSAGPLSYAVWQDDQGWHVRTNAASSSTRFSGSINAPFGVTHPRTMSPSLPLQVSGTGLSFDFLLTSGQSGFDFQAPQGSCLDFRLLIDGRDRPTRVAVGRSQTQPGPGGFQVCGPGKMDAQAVQGPKMDPAAFTELLAPYGTWSEFEGYGALWRPNPQLVGPEFIPYTDGKWVYTNAGWVFVSSYDWGWAPFHYGNWVYLDSGWYWRPGATWGPAWVEWRYGNGYFGWAPLPPLGAEVVAVNPAPFVFVSADQFMASNVRPHVISGARAEAIEPQTGGLVSAGVVEGQPVVPVNAGPAPELGGGLRVSSGRARAGDDPGDGGSATDGGCDGDDRRRADALLPALSLSLLWSSAALLRRAGLSPARLSPPWVLSACGQTDPGHAHGSSSWRAPARRWRTASARHAGAAEAAEAHPPRDRRAGEPLLPLARVEALSPSTRPSGGGGSRGGSRGGARGGGGRR